MSIAEPIAEPTLVDPAARRFSREEYYWMLDAGFFQDQRVQLIEGEVLKMSPMRAPHATALQLAEAALQKAFGSGFCIRVQLPLFLSDESEPEPDLAVVSGNPRDYQQEHPTTASLVVEISDTTLRFDRTTKRRLYAAAGIAEYWIINLVNRQLEVFRNPAGGDYADTPTLSPADQVTPIAANKSLRVADLLP
jgi:Uma2 family endonuclease